MKLGIGKGYISWLYFRPTRTSLIVKYETLYIMSCKLYVDDNGTNIWELDNSLQNISTTHKLAENFHVYIYLFNCIPIFIDENGFHEYDDTTVDGETGMQQLNFLCH